MKWKLVKHSSTQKAIGAIGFINNKAAVVTTFFPDKDWNHDGRVSLKEKFSSLFGLGGKALVEVLTQAMSDPDIYLLDPNGLRQSQGQAVTQFASGMISDAIYITYLKRGISQSCGAFAGSLVRGGTARFFVRKGMENAVKKSYNAVVK